MSFWAAACSRRRRTRAAVCSLSLRCLGSCCWGIWSTRSCCPDWALTGDGFYFGICNIPVYLFVFAVALVTNVLIIPMLPFLFLFDYALLLASTMYGISGLLCCCREDKASRKTLVIHSVAQCLFCVDVFSAVYCYIKTRNRGG